MLHNWAGYKRGWLGQKCLSVYVTWSPNLNFKMRSMHNALLVQCHRYMCTAIIMFTRCISLATFVSLRCVWLYNMWLLILTDALSAQRKVRSFHFGYWKCHWDAVVSSLGWKNKYSSLSFLSATLPWNSCHRCSLMLIYWCSSFKGVLKWEMLSCPCSSKYKYHTARMMQMFLHDKDLREFILHTFVA